MRKTSYPADDGYRCLQPEPVVIRPSGVWNSRAPFNEYLRGARRIERIKSVSGLGIYQLRHMSEREPNKDRSVKMLLKKTALRMVAASKHHEKYRRSILCPKESRSQRPNISDVLEDSVDALHALQEFSTVQLASLFERFVHCWTLNMMLAKLECGNELTREEGNIIAAMCPFSQKPLPNIRSIINSLPEIKSLLLQTPHRVRNRGDKEKIEYSLGKEKSAYRAIMFWKDYRNLCIHSGGFVTQRFYTLHSAYFRLCIEPLDHLRLEVRKPLPFDDELYNAMNAAHYRAAYAMNDCLFALSNQRRGHPEAPDVRTATEWAEEPRSNPLCVSGDHALSFLWLDEEYREVIAAQRGWSICNLYRPFQI